MKFDFDPKAVVQTAVQRGLCTPPRFTPPRSDKEIWTMRQNDKGLTARGTVPRMRSSIYGVPREVAELLTDFLRQFTAPFVVLDFQLFCTRSNVNLKTAIVSCYLSRAVEAGFVNRVGKRPSAATNCPNTLYQSSKSAVSNP